jgi:hypothetical protein
VVKTCPLWVVADSPCGIMVGGEKEGERIIASECTSHPSNINIRPPLTFVDDSFQLLGLVFRFVDFEDSFGVKSTTNGNL